MALLDSELDQIRYELGWNSLTTGAEPYIGVAAIFSQVVARFLRSGLITSSSTAVTAAGVPAVQVPLTLTAVSGTDTQGNPVSVHVGDRLIIDVDDNQEAATVQALSGNVATVLLSLAHSGSYPVTVEGGESIVRRILRNCRAVGAQIEAAMTRAGIKKVDEIEFFGSTSASGSSTLFPELVTQQQYWRQQLYRVLFGTGDRSLNGMSGGTGGMISVY